MIDWVRGKNPPGPNSPLKPRIRLRYSEESEDIRQKRIALKARGIEVIGPM